MHQLSTLPDVCLFAIFERLILFDQHQLGRVCHRLRLLQLSVDTQRNKLELVFGVIDHKQNSIRFKKVTQQLCDQIVEHFPNVVELQITKDEVLFEIDWTVKLLRCYEWASKLISLTILSDYKTDSVAYLNLIRSLNSTQLFSLKSFTFRDTFRGDNLNHIDQLTIFPQLDHFKYEAFCGAKEILNLLQTNSEAIILLKQLKSIEIEIQSVDWNQTSFLEYMNLNFEITSKFACFSPIPHFIEKNKAHLSRFCKHFCSLKTIDICCPNDRSSLAQRLNCLAPLRQLSELELHLIEGTKTQDEAEKTSIKFPSVRYLTLKYFTSKNIFNNLEFLDNFPNLNSIFIHFSSFVLNCSVCRQPFQSKGSTEEQQQNCLLHMTEPLKQCANLKQIAINFYMSFAKPKDFWYAFLNWPFNTVKINKV